MSTDVSEKRATSIFKAEEEAKQEASLKQTISSKPPSCWLLDWHALQL
jgi:hypothetical protein